MNPRSKPIASSDGPEASKPKPSRRRLPQAPSFGLDTTAVAATTPAAPPRHSCAKLSVAVEDPKAAGAGAVEGVEAVLRRVPETLPPEVLEKMQAPAKDPAVPVIASAADLQEADGVLFGFPTRYGAMAAQMKAFFDSTGSLWQEQKLAGKPAGFFVSTGTQGGGQETTA